MINLIEAEMQFEERKDKAFKEKQKATQYNRVKQHLESGKTLTRLEALNDLGILNPTARISELRADGIPVETRMVGVYNRWDAKVKVAQWYIPEQDKPLFRSNRS
jgi:hypothetical protein